MIKNIKNLKLACIAILVFFIYYFLNSITGFAIMCPFYLLTGLYCPGCGITRLLFSLVKLDFYQAFRYNPLVFILIIFSIIYWILKLILKRFNINISIPEFVWYILIVIVIIYGILRNIPEFSWLAPTEV